MCSICIGDSDTKLYLVNLFKDWQKIINFTYRDIQIYCQMQIGITIYVSRDIYQFTAKCR